MRRRLPAASTHQGGRPQHRFRPAEAHAALVCWRPCTWMWWLDGPLRQRPPSRKPAKQVTWYCCFYRHPAPRRQPRAQQPHPRRRLGFQVWSSPARRLVVSEQRAAISRIYKRYRELPADQPPPARRRLIRRPATVGARRKLLTWADRSFQQAALPLPATGLPDAIFRRGPLCGTPAGHTDGAPISTPAEPCTISPILAGQQHVSPTPPPPFSALIHTF